MVTTALQAEVVREGSVCGAGGLWKRIQRSEKNSRGPRVAEKELNRGLKRGHDNESESESTCRTGAR